MPLSELERSKVRFYLGFQAGNRYLNPMFEGQLDILPEDYCDEVRYCLTNLRLVDDKLVQYIDVVGLKSVGSGDPEFYQGQYLEDAKNTGRIFIKRLSIIMGVSVYNDIYSSINGRYNTDYLTAQYGSLFGFGF